MKKQVLLAIFLFLILNTYGQSHKFEWAKSIGGTTSAEVAYASVTDKSGNLYTVGLFSGTTDFNPGIGVHSISSKNLDAYITKLDATGNFVWVRTIPASFLVIVNTITTDTAGNIYIAGTYSDTISFDLGTHTQYAYTGNDNIFYAKLDANGNFIWAKALNDSSGKLSFPSAKSSKIKIDHSGDILISGSFEGRLDVDCGPDSFFVRSTAIHQETLLFKTNSSGEFIWAKSFGGTYLWNESAALDVDTKNNIVVCGYFDDSMDADPGIATALLVANGYDDMYLVKLNSNGEHLWSKGFGGKRVDRGTALVIDQWDNIIMSGYFNDTMTIATDTGVLTIGAALEMSVTIKFDNNGAFKWVKKPEGFGGCRSQELKLDADQHIYTLGSFYGTLDFDPGEDSFYVNGDYNTTFLTRSDSTGKFVYVKTFNPISKVMVPPSLALDAFQNVFLSGNFTERMDANPSIDSFILTSFDSDDFEAFTIKLGTCSPSSGKDSIVACGNFTMAGETFTKSGAYKKELLSSTGCDSTLTFKLTILPKPEVHTTYVSINTLSASTSGTSYQWVHCPSYTLIPGATSKTYTATADGYYSVIVSNGSCTDTAACNYIKAPVGIREWSAGQDKVNVYPNPFHDKATVTFESTAKDIKLNLYNQLGQLLLTVPAAKHSNTIEIERGALPPGVYFYQLRHTEGVIANGKLIAE